MAGYRYRMVEEGKRGRVGRRGGEEGVGSEFAELDESKAGRP